MKTAPDFMIPRIAETYSGVDSMKTATIVSGAAPSSIRR
jgi:hypothetical protein